MAAGIAESTVNYWLMKDKQLQLKFAGWQNQVSAQARMNIAGSIRANNVEDSKWWAERRDKEDFSTKKELDVMATVRTIEDELADLKE